MCLRFSALIMGTALSVSSLAHATQQPKQSTQSPTTAPAPSVPSTSINVDALAQLTGIISFCQKVDPKQAAQYGTVLSNILSGYSPATIKSDEHTDQYEKSTHSVSASLGSISKTAAVNSCRTLISGN